MTTEILRNLWYFALTTGELKAKALKPLQIMGEPVVFFRDEKGAAHAIRDICPHRGIPLSYGRVVEGQVECPYHGWKFNGDGVCTEIPSLCEGQDLDCRKIKVKRYPLLERQGAIWIFMGDKPELAPAPPQMDFFPADVRPNFLETVIFPCHIDHAVIGLMDPAHGPYVHKSWFWRTQKSMFEKAKQFAPVDFGFQMVRHEPSKNSRAYKILGGKPSTEITFRLPSVRTEHVRVGPRNFFALTALTPIDDKTTRVAQLAYWDLPLLTLLKPLVNVFSHTFLHQDLDAVAKQQEGLKYDPSLMLIKDADTQAKWYYGLKDEWIRSRAENREFLNPVKPAVLRWKS